MASLHVSKTYKKIACFNRYDKSLIILILYTFFVICLFVQIFLKTFGLLLLTLMEKKKRSLHENYNSFDESSKNIKNLIGHDAGYFYVGST